MFGYFCLSHLLVYNEGSECRDFCLFDYLSSLRKGQITNVDNMTLKRFLFFQLLSFLFSCVSLCTVYLLRWRKEEDILSTWNLSQSGSRYQLFFFLCVCVCCRTFYLRWPRSHTRTHTHHVSSIFISMCASSRECCFCGIWVSNNQQHSGALALAFNTHTPVHAFWPYRPMNAITGRCRLIWNCSKFTCLVNAFGFAEIFDLFY